MRHRSRLLRALPALAAAAALALGLAIPVGAKPPSWDKKIEGKGRFKVLKAFGGDAVLDKETGLVWLETPATALGWVEANRACRHMVIGGRGGWRLPRYEEMATIIDPATGDLPAVHPFEFPQPILHYFTATTMLDSSGPNSAWSVVMSSTGGRIVVEKDSLADYGAWCVRGGPGIDDQ